MARRCNIAITEYYVDPFINANSGTGTIGDPWGDIQYALDTITRDATNGDRINVKVGTSEILAAALTLATYGTPTAQAPIVIQGYTSAAGDGGRGVIDGNATYAVIASTSNIYFVDMRLTNCGSNTMVTLNTGGGIIRCELDTVTGPFSLVSININCIVVNSYFRICAAEAVNIVNTGNLVYGCYFSGCGTGGYPAISCGNAGNFILGNIIKVTTAGASGIQGYFGYNHIISNSIYNSTTGTGRGISVSNSTDRPGHVIVNNIIEGFSGTGGVGIRANSQQVAVIGANAFYNNATNVSLADGSILDLGNSDTLAGSPFVDAANGDFTIDGTITGVTEDGWPQTWPGLTTGTTPKPDKGAVQAGEGAGSSGGMGGIFGSIVK